MTLKKVTIIILITVLAFTACDSEKVYNIVMEYERYIAGLEKKSITLDFGDIVYLENDVKSDTALVFLHGFGGNKDTWVRTIAEWNDKYHVIVIDLPGHGESVSKMTLDYTTTDQAERLNLFLKAKKIKNFHLVGHSMGGAIALRYLEHHANNVNALILVDAMGMIQTKSDGVILVEQSDKNPLYDVCTKERFETLVNYSMYKAPYVPDIVKDAIFYEKCARRELEKVLYEDLYKDIDLSDVAKRIHIPTLILWGEKDRMTHVDNATLFHNTIKGSKLVILKEIGHVPILEDPKQTADAVDSFIKEMEK